MSKEKVAAHMVNLGLERPAGHGARADAAHRAGRDGDGRLSARSPHPPHRVEVDFFARDRRRHRRLRSRMSTSIVTGSRVRAVHIISTQIMVSKKYNTFMIRENA